MQETADGVIVLCHDTSLKRVAGVNKKVSDLTLEQIKKLDVGSWFSSEYQGEQIPTLEEVMEYAKGKIDLNIEIKNLGNSSGLPEKVIELVEKHEMPGAVCHYFHEPFLFKKSEGCKSGNPYRLYHFRCLWQFLF